MALLIDILAIEKNDFLPFPILIYTLVFRIFLLIAFIYVSKYLYKQLIYMGYLILGITVPSFVLVFMSLSQSLGSVLAGVIVSLYLLFCYFMYVTLSNRNKIDYKKAALKLVHQYPDDLLMGNIYNDVFIKEKKTKDQKKSEKNSLIIKILSYIPANYIALLPAVILILVLLNVGGSVGIDIISLLLLTLMGFWFVAGFIQRDNGKIFFKVAQELINEEEARRTSLREKKLKKNV